MQILGAFLMHFVDVACHICKIDFLWQPWRIRECMIVDKKIHPDHCKHITDTLTTDDYIYTLVLRTRDDETMEVEVPLEIYDYPLASTGRIIRIKFQESRRDSTVLKTKLADDWIVQN